MSRIHSYKQGNANTRVLTRLWLVIPWYFVTLLRTTVQIWISLILLLLCKNYEEFHNWLKSDSNTLKL